MMMMADDKKKKRADQQDIIVLDCPAADDEDPSVEAKWFCDYCTYANYQSSLYCVMCKGEKPVLDILRLNNKNLAASNDRILDSEHEFLCPVDGGGEVAPLEDINNDNHIISDAAATAPATSVAAATSGQRGSLDADHDDDEKSKCASSNTNVGKTKVMAASCDDGKWPCAVCTYLNWPIALRCTQCLTERDQNSSPLLDATNADEDLLAAAAEHLQRTLSIRSAATEAGAQNATISSVGGTTTAQNQQQQQGAIVRKQLSPTRTTAAATISRTSSTTTTTTSSVIKWWCQECTYENFPKSQKCSMCTTPRSKQQQQQQQPTITGGGAGNNNNNKMNRSNSSSPARLSPSNMGATPMSIIDAYEENQKQNANSFVNNNNNNLLDLNNATGIYSYSGSPTSGSGGQIPGQQQQQQPTNNEERQLLRKLRKHGDWRWLHACLGVVENNYAAVEEYLSYGGSPGRALTAAEVSLLNRNSAFDVGFTLIHLAIRFQREDMLPMLLSQISGGAGTGIKRVPSYVAPDLAADIRRQFSTLLRVSRKGQFNCHYVQEHATFALPSEIEDLPVAVQEQLYEELLDKDAQKQLENPPPVLNWSLEITVRLGSRLVVLWNRSAGDCLLDSAMQATWGIFDRDNVLRRALADSLHQCGHLFYPRWKEYEMIQASLMHFQLDESQWQRDWSNLLSLASQPGSSLEQLHIFALAHIFRRPIIVYGVKFVKSFRGEDIGFARFEGVYLPLLWEPSFCSRSPIALGYTRGHFSALVPTESYSSRLEASANDEDEVTFLPLMDCDMKLLPIHFINETEMGREETLMRQWLDVCMTEGGLMVAQQRLNQRPLLVAQMIEEWLNYYRRLAQVFSAPFAARRQQLTGYSSDGDTEED